MKRLGPELKMPELKAPDFLVDLYWDLRDRRLLPLVALAIVAIVAMPFLLGGDSEEEPAVLASPPGAEAEVPTAGASSADAARLTVVEAKPGLRDYRKRLHRRTPTDPFKQRHTGPVLDGAQLNSQSATLSGGETEVTTTTTESGPVTATETTEPGGASPGDSGSPPSAADAGQVTVYRFTIDVRITRAETAENGVVKTDEPTVRRRVVPSTPLPGKKAPAVTYLGLGSKGEKVLLLISPDVTAIYGDGKCTSGTETCQVVEVEPGFPETFVYGPNNVRYKIQVLKIEAIPVGRI